MGRAQMENGDSIINIPIFYIYIIVFPLSKNKRDEFRWKYIGGSGEDSKRDFMTISTSGEQGESERHLHS